MSSTNSTSHYNLSQYIGTDKPTYLVDYNGDMSKIDAGIYAAKNEADTNALNIGDLTDLTTEAKSSIVSAINEIDSHADTNTSNIATNTINIGLMANLDTTDKTSLVNAINELINLLNFTSFKRFDPAEDFTYSQNDINMGGNNLNLAKTSDGSYCKLYGVLIYNSTSSTASGTNTILTISNTGLTPAEEFTIIAAGIRDVEENGNIISIERVDLTFKTNGDITINLTQPINTRNYKIIFTPFVIQVKTFGDQTI